MYNLAKLLTEEPEKLERIGILFLKLMVTILLSSILFGFNVSITAFIHEPIPADFSVVKLILFFISLVAVWFLVWTIVGELILGEVIIYLASKLIHRKKDKKQFVNEVLSLFNVVRKEGESIYPDKNIIAFNEALHTYYPDGDKAVSEAHSRARQYYVSTTITFIVLLAFNDFAFPNWIKWVGALMVLNFLIASVVFHQLRKYLTDNLEEMKKQFCRLSYTQMIVNAIDQNPFLKHHYHREKARARIHLKRKTDNDVLPRAFKFYPVYHWNNALTKEMLDLGLAQRSKKQFSDEKKETHYDVVVCNVKPDDNNVKSILSQPGFAYMYCETEEEISARLELLLFKATKGFYRLH